MLSQRLFQKPSYEIFLRTHQGLAILCAYSIWQHVPAAKIFPRFYLYTSAASFAVTSVLQGWTILHRNGVFRHKPTSAAITHSHGTVKIRMQLSRPLQVDPGQYINLWMPFVGFWSILQSHPFVVTSWADTPQTTLELFVQPRRGFTRELLHHARQGDRKNIQWVMFSGPHGQSVHMGKYEKVIMVADGAGIAAQLPHLKRLIYGHQARQVFTRRIHLVWQINDIGEIRVV